MALSKEVRIFILIGLLVSIFLAVAVSPFASPWPDGLERVAEDKGFLEKGEGPQAWESAPIPDYAVPGLGEGALATSAAGFIGTVVVFLAGYGLAVAVRRKRSGG
jgi:cobalt/nickel transport protein